MQLVVFRLDVEEYGVEILETQEIIELEGLTRVPNSPEFVEGIINLRGEIIPIIDLKKRFSLDLKVNKIEEQRIVVVEVDDNKVGMIVDEVKEVLNISEEQISPPPKIAGGIDKKYLEGVVKFEDRLLVLLNLTKILDPEEVKEVGKFSLDQENSNQEGGNDSG
jgi:purine-binding chemotaxis protein CheW